MIQGVKLTPLRQIIDERGKVMHMLREDSEIFDHFGEIYFSCTNPGAIKAWHLHKRMTVNYVCVVGKIKLVLFDDRSNSKTKNVLQEIFLTTENYTLVSVPPGIWNGFKSIENKFSIIVLTYLMILMRCLENHIMIHILSIVGILSLHESCHFSRWERYKTLRVYKINT